MKLRCLLGFHKNKDIKTQLSKYSYGFGDGLPGIRITMECELCGKISYQSLNLMVPRKDVLNDAVWR